MRHAVLSRPCTPAPNGASPTPVPDMPPLLAFLSLHLCFDYLSYPFTEAPTHRRGRSLHGSSWRAWQRGLTAEGSPALLQGGMHRRSPLLFLGPERLRPTPAPTQTPPGMLTHPGRQPPRRRRRTPPRSCTQRWFPSPGPQGRLLACPGAQSTVGGGGRAGGGWCLQNARGARFGPKHLRGVPPLAWIAGVGRGLNAAAGRQQGKAAEKGSLAGPSFCGTHPVRSGRTQCGCTPEA
jgi:hypothetical protein